MRFFLFLVVCLLSSIAYGGIVDSPTTDWTALTWSSSGQADYFDDQQTGLPEGDLVGSDLIGGNVDPVAYWHYDTGTWSFRVRLGASLPQPGTFDHNLLIGYDSNMDGTLDGFFGVDHSGTPNQLAIWNTNGEANTSPKTSGAGDVISNVEETSDNYSFLAVDGVLDPTATSFDIDDDGNVDYFVSFSLDDLPFSPTDPVRFMVATSTQPNNINQDIAGIQGGLKSTTPWDEMGLSDPIGVPEPSTGAIMLIILVSCAYWLFKS